MDSLRDTTLITLAAGVHVRVRGDGEVQCGVDGTRSGIVDAPDAEELKLILEALRSPMPVGTVLAALEMLPGTGDAAPQLLGDLLSYRILVPVRDRTAVVVGTSGLAGRVKDLLRESGVTVRTAMQGEDIGLFLAAQDKRAPVVLVDQLARAASLTRSLSGHSGWVVPVTGIDSRVIVGPARHGGDGPCLECVLMHFRDRDPCAHAIAADVRDGLDLNPVVAAAGAAAAAVMVRRCVRVPDPPGVIAPPPREGDTVVVDPYGPVWAAARTVTPHPNCPACL